MKELNTAVWKN